MSTTAASSQGDANEFVRPTTKKSRARPKGSLGAHTREIRKELTDLTDRFDRMTVRQAFYQLEMRGVVDKTEGGYRQVQRQALDMRRDGSLDWGFITDGTRWQRKPRTFNDARDYVKHMARTYRRDLWQAQFTRIEIWLEKDALADVISDVCGEWDVALMVSRGQSSATFLHGAAMSAAYAWETDAADTFVYALYDYDAGGDRAFRAVRDQLPEFSPGTPITVERLAVTEQQIRDWSLPTRPPKKKDPDAKKWGDRPCVELDAVDPHQLVDLVQDSILRHVDAREWEMEQAVENEERVGLLALADKWSKAP